MAITAAAGCCILSLRAWLTATMSHKKTTCKFSETSMYTHFCRTPSCPIPWTQIFHHISNLTLSEKKQPSSKDPHLWGWHVAERCYARLLAIYPSDQRLHSNCWDPPPRWHRDSYVSSRWWLTAPGGWNYVLKLGGPKNKRVQMSPFTFWYFTKGPMPQSIPVILLKVFLSTPYRHDAYQHNSPLKE